jgi:hypothetical protein
MPRLTPIVGAIHVTQHRLTCRIVERQAAGTMKTQPHPSDREVLAGLVERVTRRAPYGAPN